MILLIFIINIIIIFEVISIIMKSRINKQQTDFVLRCLSLQCAGKLPGQQDIDNGQESGSTSQEKEHR